MTKSKKNLQELFNLLSRFFDKDFEIPKNIVEMSWDFIFDDVKYSDLKKLPELLDTLEYLKDVKKSNHFKELNDLVQYYEKRQRKFDDLFTKFEETKEEERFAIDFQLACKTYLKINHISELNKESLDYQINNDGNHVVEFENISYRDSLEEEKQYLAQVKGNQLINQQNITFVSFETVNQVLSN